MAKRAAVGRPYPVIEWRFTPADVARIRFAFSPLLETVLSLIVLRTPGAHSLHLPWIRTAHRRVAHLDLGELFALVPVHGVVADFLTTPPDSPLPDVADDLNQIRQVQPERLLRDVADVAGVPAAVADRINRDPPGAANRIADTLHAYWDAALARHWPRIAALLEADVLWRSQRLATGGAQLLFNDLHPTITWHGDRLTVTDATGYSAHTSGHGLLLVPSAMAWPTVRKMVAPYQPMIAYPARAIATLWEVGDPPSSQSLRALLGRTRAALLVALSEPNTTTALARRLGVTPGATSQHLSVLRANGLVSRTRIGATVLYHRTPRGDTLCRPS